MDHLSEHQRILEHAAAGNLPSEIREGGELPIGIVRELYEQGLLQAVDAGSFDGVCYLEARITVPGREYLNNLHLRSFEASPAGITKRIASRALDWGLGICRGAPDRLGVRALVVSATGFERLRSQSLVSFAELCAFCPAPAPPESDTHAKVAHRATGACRPPADPCSTH